MKKINLIVIVNVLVILLLSSCSKAHDIRLSRDSEAPISVMEDNNIDKTGVIELATKDIEKSRNQIYELTKKYKGYIFYENSSTKSNNRTEMEISIALYNEVFLDYFNEARTYGTLKMSEIRASLKNNIADYDPLESSINPPVNKRSSSIKIILNTKNSFKTCLMATINGLANVLYSISPGLIILYIIALLFCLLFLLSYVFYHCTIRRIYMFIVKKIPKN